MRWLSRGGRRCVKVLTPQHPAPLVESGWQDGRRTIFKLFPHIAASIVYPLQI